MHCVDLELVPALCRFGAPLKGRELERLALRGEAERAGNGRRRPDPCLHRPPSPQHVRRIVSPCLRGPFFASAPLLVGSAAPRAGDRDRDRARGTTAAASGRCRWPRRPDYHGGGRSSTGRRLAELLAGRRAGRRRESSWNGVEQLTLPDRRRGRGRWPTRKTRMGILRSKCVFIPMTLNRHPSTHHGKPDYEKKKKIDS